MKRTVIVLILLFSLLPAPSIQAQTEKAAPYFEYPTETWIIESQDYFGSWLEWMFIPVGGQAGDKRVWNFTWTMKEYDVPENGTANPIPEIRVNVDNKDTLQALYDNIEPLRFKTWGDFKSDVRKLGRYPITPEDKEEFKGLKTSIDLLTQDSGSFLVSFKDQWKPRKKITIGFGSTIIYSGPTNTITCTGGTKAAPITFWDLWNASNYLGWNVSAQTSENVSKPLLLYDKQFVFDCKIYVGDGETETWFNDTGVQVIFADGLVSANWQHIFRVYGEATLTLGKVISYETKSTSNGCSLIYLEDTYTANGGLDTRANSAIVNLYSCYFLADNPNLKVTYIFYSTGNVWNCIFDSYITPHYTRNPTTSFFNIITTQEEHSGLGLGRLPYRGEKEYLRRVYIHGENKAVYGAGSETYYYYEVTSRNCTYDIYPWKYTGNMYLIDCDFEKWNLVYYQSTGEVWRQYTYNLAVLDSFGVPIDDATVTLSYDGQGGGIIGPFSTSPDGNIPEQEITKGFYNSTGDQDIYAYEPYTLTITKDGYIDYSVSFNISEPISWTVGLEPLDVIFSMELLVLAAVSMIFMLMMLFSSQPGMGVISGTLAFMFWFATGMYYMYTNIADQYAIGYLFIGLGLICGIFTVYCGLKTLDPKASKDSDFL